MAAIASWRVAKAFQDALGIPFGFQKLVIEIDLKDVVRVYVKGLPRDTQVEKCSDLLRLIRVGEVNVADDCTVTFTEEDQGNG